ncbi:MAG: 16S rRNA (guanine(966)-N(2))-methyltransferase RsmD [Sporolactobacillus sp.]
MRLRVIAGENKGRALRTVSSKRTRPTTDKVKETIFNMIGPFFQGGAVLDLYAGSGGLALEALSRGANQAIFVDKAAPACQMIRENIAACGYTDRSRLLRLDAKQALGKLSAEGRNFDFVFLDPPYAKQTLIHDIQFLLENGLLAPQAIIVAEYEDSVQLPASFSNRLNRWKYKTYQGKTAVSIYRFESENVGSERE